MHAVLLLGSLTAVLDARWTSLGLAMRLDGWTLRTHGNALDGSLSMIICMIAYFTSQYM